MPEHTLLEHIHASVTMQPGEAHDQERFDWYENLILIAESLGLSGRVRIQATKWLNGVDEFIGIPVVIETSVGKAHIEIQLNGELRIDYLPSPGKSHAVLVQLVELYLYGDMQRNPIIAPLVMQYRPPDDVIERKISGGPCTTSYWKLMNYELTVREYWSGRTVVNISARNGASTGVLCWHWDTHRKIPADERTEAQQAFAREQPWVTDHYAVPVLVTLLTQWAKDEDAKG